MIQCDQIWQFFKVFGKKFGHIKFLHKILNRLWQFIYATEVILMVVNGQILKNISAHLVTLVVVASFTKEPGFKYRHQYLFLMCYFRLLFRLFKW